MELPRPIANNWLKDDLVYSGRAHVRFDRGTLEGEASIHYGETGDSGLELSAETMDGGPLPRHGMLAFLNPSEVKADGSVHTVIGPFDNHCREFILTTAHGILRSDGPATLRGLKGWTDITLSPLRATFEPTTAREPAYWCLPLLNFESEMVERHPDLDQHPLRIYRTPIVTDAGDDEQNIHAWWSANCKNQLVIFEHSGSLGFIEALSDYTQRLKSLIEGTYRHRITSVMVGSVQDRPCASFEDVEKWLPFDFIRLLDLATGGNVSFPWIEIRDDDGDLVRRIHHGAVYPSFVQGHRAINERVHHGIGRLLSRAALSKNFSLPHVRIATHHAAQAGHRTGHNIEDMLIHAFRGLDAICEALDLKTPDASTTMQEATRSAIDTIVERAATDLKRVSAELRQAGSSVDSELAARVAGQVERAKVPTIGFGRSVITLLDKFGLHDHRVMTRYYSEHPRADGRKWHDVLAHYRGIPMHRGYFDIRSGKHGLSELFAMARHLEDLLLRIVLKMLNYDGAYQPATIPATVDFHVDWVKPDTSPRLLGHQ